MGLHVSQTMLHPLAKTTDEPPAWAKGRIFEDGLGNEFKLCKHRTPTTGVAVSAGSPVGQLDTGEFYEVTTDLSQSYVGKLVGMCMVAITIAESLAGLTWSWVMVKGNPADYIAGGKGVPLGDDDYTNNNPITAMLTNDSVADDHAIYWQADNTWGGTADLDTGACPGGWSKGADGGTAMAPGNVMIDVGRQMAAT